MKGYIEELVKGKAVFVGMDIHRHSWHVTVRTEEEELFSRSMPADWDVLDKHLDRYREASSITAAYEAGYFGFWLHDHLVDRGCACIVTPPSLIPQESGNRVKTDRKDSRKMALMLAKGMLKRIWVPTREQCYHRHVARRRRQFIGDRVRVQNRIKSDLRFYGIVLEGPRGGWSRLYVSNLKQLRFGDRWMQKSFDHLLEQYEFLTKQIKEQTRLLTELSQTEPYRERVEILKSAPGIGVISAMEILLELPDIERFRRAHRLAAYVGLTPSQHSSGDKTRMGRITRAGKGPLRSTLVEAAWVLIRKDGAMCQKYKILRARTGAKRAIVAIARIFLLRLRRMLLDGRPYALGLVG